MGYSNHTAVSVLPNNLVRGGNLVGGADEGTCPFLVGLKPPRFVNNICMCLVEFCQDEISTCLVDPTCNFPIEKLNTCFIDGTNFDDDCLKALDPTEGKIYECAKSNKCI